jgi:CubicO group peptidase (beta-lactamase class C family)
MTKLEGVRVMKYFVIGSLLTAYLSIFHSFSVAQTTQESSVMQGFPPTRESQATMENYRQHPISQWTFSNAGAPLNVVMIPREGKISELGEPTQPNLGNFLVPDSAGKTMAFEELFGQNYADGVVVVRGQELLYEKYFRQFDAHTQHIWFSMSKSLTTTALGLLVESGKLDLSASPVKYIPELKGSGFERVTIQHVLDMASSIDFKESYTDLSSDFAVHYAPALNLGWLKGAADVQPDEAEIYGVHDFLAKYIKPDLKRDPGENFDYNSSNADVLGWLISRVSGQPFQDFVQQNERQYLDLFL